MDVLYLILPLLLFVLSFISGMLGLGVAFIAIPVLALFGFELKHVIMPWALLLNGLTAISAAIGFTRAKMVDWRTAVPLLIITTIAAPIGVWLLRFVETTTIWWIYVVVLFFLAYRMGFPPQMKETDEVTVGNKQRALLELPDFLLAFLLVS